MRLLVVECDAQLALRATAQWSDAAAALPAGASLCELAGGAAHGRLALTLDPKDGGPIYQGIVALEAVSIATLIEHYLETVRADRQPHRAGDAGPPRLRAAAAATARGRAVRHPGVAGGHPAPRRVRGGSTGRGDAAIPLLQALFPEDDLRVFAAQPVRFACRCSSARVANALRLIGRTEVESIVAEQGAVVTHCEFCNRRYAFDADAARALFASPGAGGGAPVRH